MSPKLAVVIYGAGKWAADSNFPNGCVIHLSHNSYLITRILRNAGVEPVLDLPTVGENLAGKFSSLHFHLYSRHFIIFFSF